MGTTIDYYFATMSPWTYLGHARFAAIAKAAGATVRVRPIDLGKVFPVSGGLPLAKRAPQRQAYRLVELRRFAEHLDLPLNLHPAHFPVAGDAAAKLIIAVDAHDGTDAAMALSGAVLRGVWAEQRNIADLKDLAEMLRALGLPERRLEDADTAAVIERYELNTQQAIDLQIFGSPTYVIDGELFWGQDRLDFVERRLAAPRG
jgi:2-hydroxychromene-2-carboxylate isomerase